MRIKEGSKAYTFTVTDLNGNKFSFEEYKDGKVLLSFYRYASCPLCNLRISQLIKKYDEFKKKGLKIIAFFESPKESMLKYVGKQEVPFPLIPDPKREIYRLYGVEKSWWKYILGGMTGKMRKARKSGFKIGKMEGQINLVPADFLIENLIIKHTYYGKNIADHIPLEEILKFLTT
ncbi:MAG: AhpC/TSA family protein [Asgard group archaeon]|nr:AhpC/TSA family protein [Asgard group archaeon]